MPEPVLTLEQDLLGDASTVANGRRAQFPADWWSPSVNALPANPVGSIGIPAARRGFAPILVYTVPRGFTFVVEFHWHYGDGLTAFVQGSGTIAWGLFVNVGASASRAVEDFGNMLTFRGSPNLPWPLRTCLRFAEGSVLSYQVNNLSGGATGFISAGLHGRLEPASCGFRGSAGRCG
jgi:hypothetical protein